MTPKIAITILLLSLSRVALGVERFPPPEFSETDHKIPVTTTPPGSPDYMEYVDVGVLIAVLVTVSILALKNRRRSFIFLLMLGSLAYFGFYRRGCVCVVGSIQNVSLSLFDASYAIPVTVIAFFLLPLVFTLFFGRTFCGAVCPLGAIQDVVLIRPVKVPVWLDHSLRLPAPLFLGLAVLFAATGSAFVICRLDPFVAFFRLSGTTLAMIIGGCSLVLAMFVGRWFCRFLCPYAVLLRPLSGISKWHVTITPDECVNCRLCEDSCPFGAILKPNADETSPPDGGKKLLAALLVLLPVLMGAGGWLFSRLNVPLSRVHATVRLAERVRDEDSGAVEGTTDASDAFYATGRPEAELYAEASDIRGRFVIGGWALGGFMGFVVAVKLISLTIRRRRTNYQVDRQNCLSCGRCFEYCPKEHQRRKQAKAKKT